MTAVATNAPTTGSWRRVGRTFMLDDPFAPARLDGETGSGGGPAGPPKPSLEQRQLLREYLGQDIAGAKRRFADFRVPQGLQAATLLWYLGIARRALANPRKDTPKADIVQRLRLLLIARALRL
jgi:hypothetical protein